MFTGIKNGEEKTINANAKFIVKSRPNIGFITYKDGTANNNIDIEMFSKEPGENNIDDIAFLDLDMRKTQGRTGNRHVEIMTKIREGKYGSSGQHDEALDAMENLAKKEIPNNMLETFDEKFETCSDSALTAEQVEKMFADSIKEELEKEGKGKNFPDGYLSFQSKQIAKKIIHDGMDYEEAYEESFGTNRENKEKEIEEEEELHDHVHRN